MSNVNNTSFGIESLEPNITELQRLYSRLIHECRLTSFVYCTRRFGSSRMTKNSGKYLTFHTFSHTVFARFRVNKTPPSTPPKHTPQYFLIFKINARKLEWIIIESLKDCCRIVKESFPLEKSTKMAMRVQCLIVKRQAESRKKLLALQS